MNPNMRPAGPADQILHGFPGAYPPPSQPDRPMDIGQRQRRNTISAAMPSAPLPYHDEVRELNERFKRLGLDKSQNTAPKVNGTTKDQTREKVPQSKPESQDGLLQGWTLHRGETSPRERNWKSTKRTQMKKSQEELVALIKNPKVKSVPDAHKELSELKQKHVDDLIQSVMQGDNDPRFDWICVYLHANIQERKKSLAMTSIDIVLMKKLKDGHSLGAGHTQAAPQAEPRQAKEPELNVKPIEDPQTMQMPFTGVPMHPIFTQGVNPHVFPRVVAQPGDRQREELLPASERRSQDMSNAQPNPSAGPRVRFEEPPHSTAKAVPEMVQQKVQRPFSMPPQTNIPEPADPAQVFTTPSKQHLFETMHHLYPEAPQPPPPPQASPLQQPQPSQPFAQVPSQPQPQRPQVRIHQKPRAMREAHNMQQEQRLQPSPPPRQHYPIPQIVHPEPTTPKRRSVMFNGQLERYLEEVSSNGCDDSLFDPEDDSSYTSEGSLYSDAFDDNASALSDVRSRQRRVSRHLQLQGYQAGQAGGYRTHGRPGPKYYTSGSSMSGTQYSIENGEVTPARTIQRPVTKVKRSNTISYGERQKPQLIQAQRPSDYMDTASPEAISAALRNHPTAFQDLPGTREWHEKQNGREPLYRHYDDQQEAPRRKLRQAKEHGRPKQMQARKSIDQSKTPRSMPAPPAAPVPPTPLPFTDGFGRPMPDPYKQQYDEKVYADSYDTPHMNDVPDDYDDYYRFGQQPQPPEW